jgi:hypothetical protein
MMPARLSLLPKFVRQHSGAAWLRRLAGSRAIWPFAAVCVFAAIYALGVNTNVFYLLFACSAAVVGVVLADRVLVRGIIVAVLAISSFVTVAKPLPPIVDTREGTENSSKRLKNGEVLHFRFLLTDIQKRRDECGKLEESVVAVGFNLPAAEIRINGTIVPARFDKAYDADIAWAALPPDARDALEVTLTAGDNVSLRQGPEVARKTEYRNALFIELQNKKCRVFYHAQAIGTGPTSEHGNERTGGRI